MRTRTRDVLRVWLAPSSTMRRSPWPPALGLAYIAVMGVSGALRVDHVVIALLSLLDLYNEKSRQFLRVFFPFVITGVVYDAMRFFYWQGIAGRVHVSEPYLFERRWFGIGGRTLNEVFLEHRSTALDLACGFAYLTYVGEFLTLGFLLFVRGRFERARALALFFLVVNLLGFATYFVYPAAPPWYVTQYGLGPPHMDIHPAAAAASRFDAILGTHFFAEMYGRGVDVYGAFPSLHVAYPLAAMLFSFRIPELRWARWPAVAFLALICVAAVYLQHHYVIDEILGFAYTLVALALVGAWERLRGQTAWWSGRA